MIPSIRFYLLLFFSLALGLLAGVIFDRDVGIFSTILLDLLVIIITFIDVFRGRMYLPQIKRQSIGKLSIGRDNSIHIAVESNKAITKLILVDNYPQQFKSDRTVITVTLPPEETQQLTYKVWPSSRGEFSWGDIHFRQATPWELAWINKKIPAKEKVNVYPDLVGLRSLSIRLTLESTGNMNNRRKLGIGTEFAEMREYRQGDDTRMIDWKATARRAKPVVKILEPEKEQTLIILLDRGRLMTAQVQGIKRFDWALNATLALAMAGLQRGDLVGVGVFDRVITTWIPPQRGAHHFSYLLDSLTPIQPVLLEPDYVGAVNRLVSVQSRRALIVLLTDIVDTTASQELLESLIALKPRYLPFCVALRDPQVDIIAHSPGGQDDIEAAYTQAVALDLLAQREIAFARLRRKGVTLLDAPANRIGEQLVDRYLQLKTRSAL